MRIFYNMKWNNEIINNSNLTTKSNSYNWDLLEEILKKIKCSVWGSPITWNEILKQLITQTLQLNPIHIIEIYWKSFWKILSVL